MSPRRAGAYWLLDDIAFAQRQHSAWPPRPSNSGGSGCIPTAPPPLTCEDGNGSAVFTKALTFTDFPLAEITLYCTHGVILLPSEY